MTIHVVGVQGDNTVCRFVEQAVAAGTPVAFVDLHAVVRHPWRITLHPDGDHAVLHTAADRPLVLPADGAYYLRTVDLSPVLPPDRGRAWRHLIGALMAYLDAVTGPVVNRPGGHSHNGAKPLHEWWLSQHGFAVPPALTSSDPDRIRAFLDERGAAIVKAVCGSRGTAQLVSTADFADFQPAAGPVHLQQRVDGFDVRVHLVGDEAFAERIDSDAVDYRGSDAVYRPFEVPSDVLALMRDAAREMDLVFTGWDFRVSPDGRWWCLEANPMPGYDFYDRRCDGAISAAVRRVLVR
ncbi:hypothetical protein StrepF001_42180 [Streptomyces sp. F001]|uniref:ATP-grasp domain-containing protein n=1 Tax=Streptomyces sp. F001 TaxID=1510026 RepID=UPI00101E80F0|nr:hypothetical protein [Streptomyces sp. F001]RZB13786.1 hypothetical protein StrepF001_42180 [Streptomyces sp. F001]